MHRPLFAVVALVGTLLAGCGVQPLTSAARADAAVQTMDAHFYQSGRWQGAGYWQNAQAFSVVLDALQRTHAATYEAMVGKVYAANSQHGKLGDFTAPYVDDEGWWALDWTRAWDLTGNPAYLQTAKAVFANMAGTWDQTCGGGVWWNTQKSYKNAIPNELFLLLAVELHERTPGDTGSDSYLAWARREADWFEQSGMINAKGLVNDGLRGCRNNGGTTWTYNQGVILAGLAELSKDTGDQNYLQLAERIANAATSNLVDAHGILQEPCEASGQTCDQDQEQFKGIFVRYLWWLYTVDHKAAYRTFLQRQLQSLWSSRTSLGDFGLHWSGSNESAMAGSNPVFASLLIDVEVESSGAMALTSTAVAQPEHPRLGTSGGAPAMPTS